MNGHGSDDKFDRLLRHAMHNTPDSEPPADFASQTAALVADQPETAGFETWFVRGLIGLAVCAVGAFAMPFINAISSRALHLLDSAPWQLLLLVAGMFGALKFREIAQAAGQVRLH